MNIGGPGGGSGGARWPMAAAAAGGNPYMYGAAPAMGGAAMGGYRDLQQSVQQQMLPSGAAYNSMDAMFGVGGGQVALSHLAGGQVALDDQALQYGQLANYGQVDYPVLPGGDVGVPYGTAYYGAIPELANLPQQQQQPAAGIHGPHLPQQHSIGSLGSSPGTASAAATLAEAHSGQFESMLAANRAGSFPPLPQQPQQQLPAMSATQRGTFSGRSQPQPRGS